MPSRRAIPAKKIILSTLSRIQPAISGDIVKEVLRTTPNITRASIRTVIYYLRDDNKIRIDSDPGERNRYVTTFNHS